MLANPRLARTQDFVAIATLLIAIAAGLWVYGGAEAFDVSHPVPYRGDGLSHAFIVKTIIDVGWYPVDTPFVGAPFGASLYDYPYSDGLNFLIIRLLGLGSSNWIVVSGLFYLSGFFLAGLTAYFVMRRLGVGVVFAVASAALFALMPYHFARRGHLLLASYAVVPLGVWLAYIAWEGVRFWRAPRRLKCGLALAVVAVGSGGAYYAFFSAFLITVAGLARALSRRSLRESLPVAGFVVALCIVVLTNVATTIGYQTRHGPNAEVAHRNANDSEIYGLKLTQLLLPSPDHRVPAMRDLTNRYSLTAPLVNENASASLGLVGSFGLLFLFAYALRRIAGAPDDYTALAFLATLALAAFLLGTIGGIGALFSLLISSMIRGYNRVSIVIGFVSLTAVAAAMERACRVRETQSSGRWAIACAAVLLVIGANDQIPRRPGGSSDAVVASDRTFVQELESKLPPGTAVLQMPYQPYPEATAVQSMENYGPLRGYLFSRTLRWSYGAMRGREGDLWLRALFDHPIAEQLDLASRSGFGAVYVDRRGYADGGTNVEAALRKRLGAPIAESSDRLLVAYRMEAAGSSPLPLERVLLPIETPIGFDRLTLPGIVAHIAGFSGWEPWGRWTDGKVARIQLARALPSDFTLHIETAMALPSSVGTDLTIRIGNDERLFQVGSGPTQRDVSFHLNPPASAIEILIPTPRSPAELGMSTDARKLGIGLKSITIEPR